MDLLVCLAKRRGEVVSKAEIFQEVWAGSFVTDDALIRCIGELRRIFQDDAKHPTVIETVAKRGYRIVLPVSWESGDSAPAPEPACAPAPRRRRWLWAALATAGLLAILTPVVYQPLRMWLLRSSSPSIRSIAVLPLLNLSGDPGQEYFADGMTELLTSNLSRFGNLRVISRTSAMNYKGSRKPLRTIGRELRVDAVLEGSVVRSGQRVRIVVQLIETSTDTHLWTEIYERDLQDVLSLESELAQAIVRQIRLAVTPDENARVAYRARINPEAYEAYLKGMFLLNKFTPEGFEQGMRYLRQAVEMDPSDPFAYAGIALGYSIIGHDRFPAAFEHATAAAKKSLELGGELPEAHVALGMRYLYSDWDLPAAGRELQRGIQLKPNFAEARRNYSWYLRLVGRSREGLKEMRRAVQLEPLAPLFPADLAWQYFEEGDLDAALKEARKSTELNPDFSEGLAVAGWVLAERGRLDEALREHQKAAAADAAWTWPLGRTYAIMGRRDEALKVAAALDRAPDPMGQWGLAVIYAALGDKDKAFGWLNAALKSRFSWMPWVCDFSRRDSDLFAGLRGDPRFEPLVRKIAGR